MPISVQGRINPSTWGNRSNEPLRNVDHRDINYHRYPYGGNYGIIGSGLGESIGKHYVYYT